jgi:hypothetical protein
MKRKLLWLVVVIFAIFLLRPLWLPVLVIPNLLPDNQFRPLETITSQPKVDQVTIPYKDGSLAADLYLPKNVKKTMLAIHGANELGKDDPRIANFGNTFARSGIAVLIPTINNITREKFTPEATEEVLAAYTWLTEKYQNTESGMMAFSVASGPMFLAAADDKIKNNVDYLISFGGYYELKEVLRNVTTGADRDPFGHELIDQQYRRLFGTDESVIQLLSNTDPAHFDRLYDQLSPHVKHFIEDLTPKEHMNKLTAEKIMLVHGDPDYIIPMSESQGLKTALGERAELTILKSFSHVNVQLPKINPANIINYYVPEFWKLYKLILSVL